MLNFLHNLFGGSSPVTGYLGSAVVILDVANQALTQGGAPHDAIGWVNFLGILFTGLGLRLAKDANRSNAPMPAAQSKPVN